MKRSHDNMLMEMENLNMQLKEEQNRVLTLQNELKFGTTNNRKIIEVRHIVQECYFWKLPMYKYKLSEYDLSLKWFYLWIFSP